MKTYVSGNFALVMRTQDTAGRPSFLFSDSDCAQVTQTALADKPNEHLRKILAKERADLAIVKQRIERYERWIKMIEQEEVTA